MRPFLAGLLLAATALAEDAVVLSQDLDLTLDPGDSSFVCVARIRARGPGALTWTPLEGVTVSGIPVGALPEGESEWTLRFAGKIRNPVRKSSAATWVAGDSTPGTIGPEGTYLVRGFFVPTRAPCRYRITLTTPLPHRAVAAGRRVAEAEEAGVARVTYEASYPLDGPVVVAGPWEVDERTVGDVVCRTYLHAADRRHAKLLLDSCEAELARFQPLFGPIPDGRFDVVENFFATGYGFSNFTLLGDTVIQYVCAKTARQGGTVLPAGYIDHELVHCWLGNYLHVAYERGNWCEALTTYFANYGATVRDGSDAAYREKVSRRFSLRVGPQNDYPLREFRDKKHDYENDIGYGKGSMVFSMLAGELGREKFHQAVRHVVKTRGGRALGWDDLVVALGEGCGRDLKAWFEPWLARTGAPVFEFGPLRVEGNRVAGTIRQTQEGEAYPVRMPVVVRTDGGIERFLAPLASRESAFSFTTGGAPRELALDPEHEIFRRIPRARIAPCLEAVLTAPARVGAGDARLLEAWEVPAGEAALPADRAVLLLGVPDELRAAVAAGARRQTASLVLEATSFSLDGTTYDQPTDGLLFSYARPDAPGRPVTFFHGNGKEAFARLRYLPYYASDGWVVFRDGRPAARGSHAGDRAAIAEITEARRGAPESLVGDLLHLTDPARAGRLAGTTEAYELANHLRGRLFRAGAKPVVWPAVPIEQGRIAGKRELVLLDADGKRRLDDSYFPFHRGATPAAAPVFGKVVSHPTEEARGNCVLLPEDADDALLARYSDAAIVGVVATEPTLAARAREAAWENALPPILAERFAKRGGNVAVSVSGMLARSAGKPYPAPCVYLTPEAGAALKAHGGKGVFHYKIERVGRTTSNVVGMLGEPRTPGVLLSAHWDGVGRIGDEIAAGASDNAAGIAVVLWVAEQLKRDLDAGRLARPVVVVLFGGEEVGLAGSRQFARALGAPGCPLARPMAAVNVDGIANSKPDTLYCIGRSHHAALLAALEKTLPDSGFTLGRDIDRFAFAEGSDHWPLHQAGIPAVTLFNADYRAMNTLQDRTEKVDIETMRRLAKVVYRMVRSLAS